MSWFRKSPPPLDDDPQETLIPYEKTYEPAPTPPDLLEAAARGREWSRAEWQRTKFVELTPAIPAPPAPPTVPWTREVPTDAGVYWHVPSVDVGVLHLIVLIRCGQQLCLMQRRAGSDSVAYLSVRRIGGWFAGPIATPEGVALEEIKL